MGVEGARELTQRARRKNTENTENTENRNPHLENPRVQKMSKSAGSVEAFVTGKKRPPRKDIRGPKIGPRKAAATKAGVG
jgi:hypothetical protein